MRAITIVVVVGTLLLPRPLLGDDIDSKKITGVIKSLGACRGFSVGISRKSREKVLDAKGKPGPDRLLKDTLKAADATMKTSALASLLAAAREANRIEPDTELAVWVSKPQPRKVIEDRLGGTGAAIKIDIPDPFIGRIRVSDWTSYGWIQFGFANDEAVVVQTTAGSVIENLEPKRVALPVTKPQKPEDPEETAARRLKFAKDLLQENRLERAKDRLEEIDRFFPRTNAAAEARTLLKTLK